MPSTTATTREADRTAGLVNQYRAIGPAAIIAALLCAPRARLKNSFAR